MSSLSQISEEYSHSLLEARSPAYTNVTVRRAYIVWMYCGQKNSFRDVCNYYHHLEAMEETLPIEWRQSSRHHEFNLFTKQPPTSAYLNQNFPKLYAEFVERQCATTADARKEKKIKTKDFNKPANNGTSMKEIIEASRMIKIYCKEHKVMLKKFLEDFKEHARKCELKDNVNNVSFYIKRKMVQAELELEANYPKTLGFLNADAMEDLDIKLNAKKAIFSLKDNADIESNQIKLLTRDRAILLNDGVETDENLSTAQIKNQNSNVLSKKSNDINKRVLIPSNKLAIKKIGDYESKLSSGTNNFNSTERKQIKILKSTKNGDLNVIQYDYENRDLRMVNKENRFLGLSFNAIGTNIIRKI